MHLTVIIVILQSWLNTGNELTNLNLPFSVTGDDMGIADQKLYQNLGLLLEELDIQINKKKSFVCSTQNRDEVYGEYLKKMVYNGVPFQPLSPRLFAQWINSPRTNLYGVLLGLIQNNFVFNGTELLQYASFKEIDAFALRNKETKDKLALIKSVFESTYFFLLLDDKYQGVNLNLDYYLLLFPDEVNKTLSELYSDIEPSNNHQSRIIIGQIKKGLITAKTRADKAIISVFSLNGLKLLNQIIRPTSSQVNLYPNIDFNTIQNSIDNKYVNEVIMKYPIFRVIYQILIEQKLTIERKIEDIREKVEKYQVFDRTRLISDIEILFLRDLLKDTKKNLIVIDIQTIFGLKEVTTIEIITPINKRLIDGIKETYLEKVKETSLTRSKSEFEGLNL